MIEHSPFTKFSHSQRVSLSALLVIFGVGAMETAHFSSGSSLLREIGYFAIPALVAILFFNATKERVWAFILLVLLGFLTVATAIFVYLTRG